MLYNKNVKLILHLGGETLNNKVKVFREKFGYTQDDLAQKLEVSRQTIISLEKGKYNPSIILAFKISKLFNVKIEDVFIYEEESL